MNNSQVNNLILNFRKRLQIFKDDFVVVGFQSFECIF